MFNRLPKSVSIVEVGPRDGLQHESTVLPIGVKKAFISALVSAGCKRIEVGSFVSPKWVPQMADTPALMVQFPSNATCTFSALTPNLQGVEAAINAGVTEIAVFTGASNTFTQRNINCTIDQSLERFTQICAMAKRHNIKVRGYVSCIVDCPYEGATPINQVVKVCKALLDLGCFEVSLGDTIGTATPIKISQLLDSLLSDVNSSQLAVHFHDTYGQALANVLVALQYGISTLDSAAGGLGGCPYAKGASGNLATEDLVFMLEGMGIDTGIDIALLAAASQQLFQALPTQPYSKVLNAMLAS